ncbi:MAG TPA: hypothetical protein VHV51_12775 [Polyangiaceae bacterium]|nr:hypothetical protein [Polyangiaceae bacterium]
MNDTELRPVARDLLETARLAQTPNAAQRERAYQALMAGLGGGSIGGLKASSATNMASTASSIWLKWAAIAAILGAVGGTAIGAKHRHTAALLPTVAPTATGSAAADTELNAPNIDAPDAIPLPAAPSISAAPSASSPAPAKSASATNPASDDLAGDVSLLHQALAASHAGNAAHALELAQKHARLYPNSRLGVERSAIEVRSLCALGRAAEARKLAARLRAQAPNSPVRAALEETCVGR